MNKNLQTLLGVAVLAGVGYYLYNQYQKPKPAAFANFMSDESALGYQITEECVGDTGTVVIDGQTLYNCCKMGWFGKKSQGKECGGGKPTGLDDYSMM